MDSLVKKLAKNLFIAGNHLDEIGLVAEANKVSDVLVKLIKKAEEDGDYEIMDEQELSSESPTKTVEELMEYFRELSEDDKDNFLASIIEEEDRKSFLEE